MTRSASRRTSRKPSRKNAKREAARQPTLLSIVAGAIEVGAQVSRAAWRTAQDFLESASRLAANPEPGASTSQAPQPSVPRDALPEDELNAIAKASRRKRTEPTARHVRATRKPLSRAPARRGQSTARAEPRKTRRGES